MSYPRVNTVQLGVEGASNGITTLKLPNASTTEPADESTPPVAIGPGQRWRVKFLSASFGSAAAPTTPATLTLTDGTRTLKFDVTGPLVLPGLDWQFAPGAEVSVTLAAGGTGLVGHINISAVVEG